MKIFGKGNLQITDVRSTDEGTLRCLARNKIGIREQKITLKVSSKPKLDIAPGVIDKTVGETAEFLCENNRPGNFQWFRNGQPLLETLENIEEFENIKSSKLKISPVRISDAGYYQCMDGSEIVGSFLKVNKSNSLSVNTADILPKNLRVWKITKNSVTLKWDGSSENSYLISQSAEKGPEKYYKVNNASQYKISGLKAGKYVFSIAQATTRRVKGGQKWSPKISVKIPLPENLPETVKNFQILVQNETDARFSWEPDKNAKNFTVKISGESFDKIVVVNKNFTALKKLPLGSEFTVEITPNGENGVGETTSRRFEIPPQKPSEKVSNLKLTSLTSKSALVEWEPIKDKSWRGNRKNYVIRYKVVFVIFFLKNFFSSKFFY